MFKKGADTIEAYFFFDLRSFLKQTGFCFWKGAGEYSSSRNIMLWSAFSLEDTLGNKDLF